MSSRPPARFCIRCGAARSPDARFCSRCGEDLLGQDARWDDVPTLHADADPVPAPWVRTGAVHPVRLVVRRASRHGKVGALLRLPAAVLVVAVSLVWLIGAIAAAALAWFARVAGRPYPEALRRFTTRWLVYSARASAYAFMLTPEFPNLRAGSAVDVELPEPEGRPWLRLPALLPVVPLAILEWFVAVLCAPVAWVAVLALGRLPDGLADVMEQPQRYRARFWAYALLLCDTYPWFQPERPAPAQPAPEHPVPDPVAPS